MMVICRLGIRDCNRQEYVLEMCEGMHLGLELD